MSDQKPIRPLWAIRLRAEREARGWGKRRMARQLLTTVGAPLDETRIRSLTRQLRHWETGRHFPRDWASWLAETLDVDETELFGSDHALPTFGKTMYRYMVVQHVRLTDLAQRLGIGIAELARISDDVIPPSPSLAGRLDALLNADGRLAALAPEPAPEPPAVPPGTVDITGSPDDWDDMERRRLLQGAIGLGAAAFTPDAVRRLADLTLTAEPRDLDDWHLACADHLYAIRTRPPADVRDELLFDLLTVQRHIEAPDTNDVTELQRVKAGLSILHANVLTRLGEHGPALRWWRTAREAADASGDLDLRVLVREAEAGFGLYGQRDPETVLQLTQKTRRLAGDKPSLGLALVTTTEAKALSLLGRHSEAESAMHGLRHAAPDNAPSGLIPAYWTSDQVHFTESWVYAGAGEETRADEARDRVLAHTFLDYQYAANVRLHEAKCTVVNGGVDLGARQAATVLDVLPPALRSHMITETGNTVLRSVPLGQRDRPAVREFWEMLVKTAPRPALTSGT